MGNQMSVPQRAEDQENDAETDTHEVRDCAQNGMPPVMVSTYTVQLYDDVDLGISVQEDSVATSSPGTVETSAVAGANGKNLGKEANPQTPAAKSRFFLTLSRPVPGRTGDRAGDSSTEPGKLDVSSSAAPGNKGPSDSMALPPAAAPGPGPDKTPGRTPADHQGFSATLGPAPPPPGSGGAAPSKPKDSSFFDKLFKLDKGQEKAPTVGHLEARSVAPQGQADDLPGFPGQSHDAPAERDIAEDKDEGQEVTPASCSLPRDPEGLEIAKEGPQTAATTENNNSVMSFLKTLVSSNKAETKKDLEDTGAEKSPATSADLKADKATFVPPETQGAAKNPTPTETAKEGAKQKGGPSSLPLSKLFWKKSVKEDSVPTGAEEIVVCESPVEVIKSEEADCALQTVDLSDEGEALPAPPEGKPKREDGKPPRTSLLALLRQMSVKGDGRITHPEEINGKDSSYQASDPPQKAVPPAPEPAGAGPRGREGSAKAKAPESNRQRGSAQDAKEPAPCACAEPAAANALQNRDKPPKRAEKRRQSLGGFFKGLGPKRMMDAQVQTDPVSIGPVGKSK
ncbi:PREDICTED: breast carcinoma-amplified sequence 1 [Miniopterus natalensis]|uniref:breast carcinoma-amplified sequence 1 n=1 Tax=Miniopterus natalensis TaxID=291302 RepID=UPI0007A6CB20|nr:PREDICTED: breast carcinoma-amplified sequence 1 [Miniopterus natalensis]